MHHAHPGLHGREQVCFPRIHSGQGRRGTHLQVMAESTQRLSDAVKQRHPEADWRGLAGLRNVLAHGYLGIDAERIWELIDTRLAALRTSMESIRAELTGENESPDGDLLRSRSVVTTYTCA